MHASVQRWVSIVLPAGAVAGRRVLEVGSYDVNGSVRPLVEAHHPATYVGVDVEDGPGVDLVVDCHGLAEAVGAGTFDVVLSTEMLEHVTDWRTCVAQMCEVVKPGGILLLTTRSPGFPYHPFPQDTWRYTVTAMNGILREAKMVPWQILPDPEAPGVFARAHKPLRWVAPWRDRPLAEVFAGDGVTAMVAP